MPPGPAQDAMENKADVVEEMGEEKANAMDDNGEIAPSESGVGDTQPKYGLPSLKGRAKGAGRFRRHLLCAPPFPPALFSDAVATPSPCQTATRLNMPFGTRTPCNRPPNTQHPP